MAFDQTTRNRLQRFVSDTRSLLTDEFTRQLQQEYGLDPKNGEAADLSKLSHLDDSHLETARVLREVLAHYQASEMVSGGKKSQKDVLDRIVREQAFTVLNRLAALRMMEARGLLRESIANGYQSQGFQLYERLAGHALGETGDAYRCYLFSLFDEFALDLKVLFDRNAPQGLLFPRESTLLELLDLLDQGDIEALWGEDETIGWLYQYFNSTEERKKMRKESAAPRNSRELAVRNQFFTPRYVVEFLSDNTLGRIWYEMTRGKTRLADQCRYLVRRPTEIFLAEGETVPETPDREGLSQEELLRQPVHIPHRPLKDPREILLLDPACGSMHFGLYAFDLFETIYEEGWNNGSCPAFQETYPSRDEFLKDVPRLIIEHNIHGIDIDPRAVQIAGLSLWLRAQKAWQAQGVKPANRPRVCRSNIVCAEPMPGSPEMLDDFVAILDPPLLGELVKTVFDKMQLAGEAGSLLKIEEEIRTAIDTARKEWLKEQDDLLTRKDGSQEEFFDTAEQQVIDALRAYAEQADADSYQRRLFAEDAARGFAFIDLCQKRYDSVVMNPPFGEPSISSREYLYPRFESSKLDVFAAFVDRGVEIGASVGAITSRTCFFLAGFEEWRRNFTTGEIRVFALADLSDGVLDAMVEAAAYCLIGNSNTSASFLRATETQEKGDIILEGCRSLTSGERNADAFLATFDSFKSIPKQPFAYWLSPSESGLFDRLDGLQPKWGNVIRGPEVPDLFRAARCWWEVESASISENQRWVWYAKGGEFKRFAHNVHLVVDYEGARTGSCPFRRPGDSSVYFRSGLTFSQRTTKPVSFRVLPAGCLTSPKGPAIVPRSVSMARCLLGLANTRLFSGLVNSRVGAAGAAARSYDLDILRKTPLPNPSHEFCEVIEAYVSEALLAGYQENQRYETSADFLPASIQLSGRATLSELCKSVSDSVKDAQDTYDRARRRVERLVLEMCEIADAADQSSLDEQVFSPPKKNEVVERILSEYLGTTFGRWDIRYATSERQPPKLSDPFDSLPACPPGMLRNIAGLPAEPADIPANYPLPISWSGILVDDDGHPEDIVARVREAIEVIWKDHADAIEQEACEIVGVKSLRDYFRHPNTFFAIHLKCYSKSRRKAPIYWPLATTSCSYTLWIYYPALTGQTLYTAVNDFVEPKLNSVVQTAQSLRSKINRSRAEEKELEQSQDFEFELTELRDTLLQIARDYKPNHDDGVQITAAPLWPLFRHRPWQKVLKETWKKLEKGDYDWAHLAMNYWPDRVHEKCRTDKSLAIAHGLEELCEAPAEKEKKKRGRTIAGE